MLRGTSFAISSVVLGLLVTGCSSNRNLYHYHRTVVGLDIAGNVSGNSPSGHLILGYSRRLIVFLPPEVKEALATEQPDTTGGVPLPASVFCTQVKASLGGLNAFREILATGQPAVDYASQLAASATGITEWKDHNFVCPGFKIPGPPSGSPPSAEPTAAPLPSK